jgi:hypothetical protein
MDSKFIANLALSRLVKAGARNIYEIEPRLLTAAESDILSCDRMFCRHLEKMNNHAQLYHLFAMGFSPYFSLSAGNRDLREASPLGYSSALTNLPGIFGWTMVFSFSEGSVSTINSVSTSMLGSALVHMLYSQALPYGRMLSGSSILDANIFKKMLEAHGDGLICAIDAARRSPQFESYSPSARIGGDMLYSLLCRLNGIGDSGKMLTDIRDYYCDEVISCEAGKMASALLVIEPNTFEQLSGAVLDTLNDLNLKSSVFDAIITRVFLKINEKGTVDDARMELILSQLSQKSKAELYIEIVKRISGVGDQCAVRCIQGMDIHISKEMSKQDVIGIINALNTPAKLAAILKNNQSILTEMVGYFYENEPMIHSSELFNFFECFANLPLSPEINETCRAKIIEMSGKLVSKSMMNIERDGEFFIGKKGISKYLSRLGELTHGEMACQNGVSLLKVIDHKDLRDSYLEHSDSRCLMRYANDADSSLRKAIISSDMGL